MFLAVAFFLLKPTPPPPIKLPNPNGYDDLVKAGQMIVGQRPDCNFKNSECIEEWKTFFEKNSEALQLVRVGLSRESRVPLDRVSSNLAVFKVLAEILQSEGNVAVEENRLDDAIVSYLDVIRLSEQIRGGSIIDAFVSGAIESMGMKPLQEIAEKMTVDQRRRAIKTLVEVHSKRASFDEVMAMERIYADKTYTLSEKFSEIRYYFTMRAVERKLEAKIKYRQARNEVLLVDLAVRNYQAEKSHPPKTLAELVPEYLPFLPKDIFSGNDFVYLSQSNSFTLYGVGPDGKDDGGKPIVMRGDVWPGDILPNTGF